MMQALKNRFATWVLRVFAVLLIISFGAWGIGDMISGQGAPTEVAEVGDTLIGANEFSRAFQLEMDRLRATFGPEFGPDQARELGFVNATLGRLVGNRLIALAAARLGLEVGDDQIRQRILAQPGFRNSSGQFDQRVFRAALAQNGLTEARYTELLRGEIARSHLIGAIDAGGAAPDRLTRALYRYRNEKRAADVVEVLRSSQANPGKPDDAQLSSFHTEHAARFTSPERRNVTAVHLDPADLAAEIKISEDDVRAEFENRLSSLIEPERRRLRQILIQDEAAAQRVADSLRQGRAFADAAKTVAGEGSAVTELGMVKFDDLPPEIAEIAFALDAKRSSAPIRTPLGWHVVTVDEIEPGTTPKFEELRESLGRDLARELAVDRLIGEANRLEDALAGGAALGAAASQLGVEPVSIRSLDAAGATQGSAEPEGLAGDERFVRTAFETAEGEISDLVDTPDGGYFVLRVDRVIPPALRPLDSIRAEATAAWKRNRRDGAAKRQAEEIFERVKGGSSLASIAKEKGLALKTSKPFTRFEQPDGPPVDPALAAELFRTPKGGAAMSVTEDGYAVAQTTRTLIAEPGADDDGLQELRSELKAAVAADMLQQFSSALRRDYPVEINAAALDRFFNQTGR